MLNINERNKDINDLLKHNYNSTKVELYFSSKTAGADFDPYEKNYTTTNLNPITIKCYVRDIKAEKLVWNKYGLAETGSKEIITEDKYSEWFRKCNKVKIDGDTYQVYRENVGNRCLIEKRPFKTVRIIIQKVK